MKKPVILIAGGDMRQLYCAARLARKFEISIIGFDMNCIPDDISLRFADETQTCSYDCAVLPVAPLTEDGHISAPCGTSTLLPASVRSLIKQDGIVFAGKADENLRAAFNGLQIEDYLLREEMSLKNAVPTAEGAVELALQELPVTLNGLSVLIVGMGRIGTALAQILKGFGADITAAVHNSRGSAKARLHGIKAVPTRRLGGNYSLVFNTVPQMIFDREMLGRFSSNTLFIDLASKPGGIDFDSALELGIKAIWALGLPGKTAPVTSGEIIAETVASMILERSEIIE